MQPYSKECSIIAYFFSKFDEEAVTALGYSSRAEAFRHLTKLFNKKTNYIKLRRDEFDAIVSSVRQGWNKRPPSKTVWALHCELKFLSFDEMKTMVLSFIDEKTKKDEETGTNAHSSGNKKTRIRINGDLFHEIKIQK